ncbi:MAG: CpsD/CapB family tyrosine-protein kinase [Brooklawnia sp.]|uniref:tyrosine-protein kinase family protein n=1 Tax=Brooklawnia sp. TaxID=2699740 RepID=UPI003C76068E
MLSGRAHHTDVLQPVAGSDHLQVMAAGPIPPNPSELLGSDKMRQLINTLTSDAMVIIDSPPVLPVTDSTVLSTQADGALVVVSIGATTYDMLEQALDNLNKANAKPLGVVLNKVPKSGPGSVYYQYTGDYVNDSPAARPVGADAVDRTAGTRRRDNARRAAAAAV